MLNFQNLKLITSRLSILQTKLFRTALSRAFILFVFPLGLVLAFVTPPGLVGDEPAQMVRAVALLHGALIGERVVSTAPDGRTFPSAGVRTDPAIIFTCMTPGDPITRRILAEKTTLRWSHQTIFAVLDPIAVNFPIFYVPSAFGIGATRWLGGRPFQAVYAGRLVSYCCYLLLGVMALALARRGQAMIFVALSMPMTLSLGASCAPDGLFIATAALGTALFSRGAWLPGAACLAAVILVKPPYALLAMLALSPLPPFRAWAAERHLLFKRLGLTALIVLPGLLWFAYAMIFVSAPEPRPAYHPGPLWPGNPDIVFFSTNVTAQLRVVLAHPLIFIGMVWNSMAPGVYFHNLYESTIGILNWLRMILPSSIYNLWVIGAAGALVADLLVERDYGPVLSETLILLAVIITTVILVWLSEYLTWTNVGLDEIDGPQGRYLLPLIPILGFALPRIGFRGAWIVRRAAISLPMIAALWTLILLPRWLAIQFYTN
jgi:hypothetical protein